jgi:hypothetical protein
MKLAHDANLFFPKEDAGAATGVQCGMSNGSVLGLEGGQQGLNVTLGIKEVRPTLPFATPLHAVDGAKGQAGQLHRLVYASHRAIGSRH